jgi:hypothetical protein
MDNGQNCDGYVTSGFIQTTARSSSRTKLPLDFKLQCGLVRKAQLRMSHSCSEVASENVTGGQEAGCHVSACLQQPSATPHEYCFNNKSTSCTCTAESRALRGQSSCLLRYVQARSLSWAASIFHNKIATSWINCTHLNAAAKGTAWVQNGALKSR